VTAAQQEPVPRNPTGRLGLTILLLSLAGGTVDAAVLLGFRVLTAGQTGNTVLLAVALARHEFAVGLASAISVLGYVGGVAAGEVIIVACGPRRTSTPVRGALLAELAPLTASFVAWRFLAGPPYLVVALAAIGMGMQSAAVLRLHAGPATTYITGNLTICAVRAVQWLHLVSAENTAPIRKSASSIGALVYGGTWGAYLGGAIVGGALFLRVGALALVVALIEVVGAIICEGGGSGGATA
jgi:uncharacterized membrane protein YoaK (UPF0700 family)